MREEYQEKRGFHFDKTISYGHIISTLTFILWGMTWASQMDKRVEANKIKIEYVAANEQEDRTNINLMRSDIKIDLKEINAKLDRIIEAKR